MAEPETDPGFPSGKWVGFYTYRTPSRHRMDLHLTFSEGHLAGDGVDDIGRFTIHGVYSCETRACTWVKQYIGRHHVDYRGVQQGRIIQGTWSLRTFSGGFMIWPAEHGELTAEYFVETETEKTPVEPTRVEAPEPARR
ncbi:MAG: hypothetical protein ACYCW6_18155 [Candidatus Xenobia bacterium]